MSQSGALILGGLLLGGMFVGAYVQEEREKRASYDRMMRTPSLTREQADLKKVREMAQDIQDEIARRRRGIRGLGNMFGLKRSGGMR